VIAQLEPLYVRTKPGKTVVRLLSYTLFEGRPLTTRGRWINPIVLFLLRQGKKVPLTRRVQKPVFIIGIGRSGTTVLGLVLSVHRDFGFLNEPKALWHVIYPQEDLVGNYKEGFARYHLTAEEATATVSAAAHRLFGLYLIVTNSRRLVDKYPELVFRIPFVKAIFPDAKFLLLCRNGWDICRSIDAWSRSKSVKKRHMTYNWWGVNNRKWRLLLEQVAVKDSQLGNIIHNIRKFTKQTDMAAVEWILSMREGLRMLDLYPDDIHVVRYERLVSNPQDTLRDIMRFCEVPLDETVVNYARHTLRRCSASRQHISLNPVIVPVFESTMLELGYNIN